MRFGALNNYIRRVARQIAWSTGSCKEQGRARAGFAQNRQRMQRAAKATLPMAYPNNVSRVASRMARTAF